MTIDVFGMLIALGLLFIAVGYRLGFWMCMRQFNPQIQKALDVRAELENKFRDSELRQAIIQEQMKARVVKLKAKLKKKRRIKSSYPSK